MPRSETQKKRRLEKMEMLRAIDNRKPAPIDSQISIMLGVSEVTLNRMRKDMGYKKVPPYKGFTSGFTQEIQDWVKANHPVSTMTVAEKFNVSARAVEGWFSKHGIHSGHVGKWSRFNHPKGFTGQKHSEQSLKKMSDKCKAAWSDPNHIFNSEQMLQLKSDNSARYQFEKRLHPRYSRSKKGKREDLGGVYFRSAWEANYARYLNFLIKHGEVHRWEFEADTFWFEKIKRGCRFYTPDFKIWDSEALPPYYVEVKGWMDPKSKTKLDRMKRYYPDVRIDIVGPKEYREIKKKVSWLLPGWES